MMNTGRTIQKATALTLVAATLLSSTAFVCLADPGKNKGKGKKGDGGGTPIIIGTPIITKDKKPAPAPPPPKKSDSAPQTE